jgi:hypothetical protein
MEGAAVALLVGCVCWCVGQLLCWWRGNDAASETPSELLVGGHRKQHRGADEHGRLPAEHQPLLGSSALQRQQQRRGVAGRPQQQLRIHVYPQRFWIAFLWSWFGVVGAFAWNMYAPIEQPMYRLYGWDSDMIDWCSNSNNLAFVITAPAWAWFADTHGLRPAVLLATWLLFVASAMNLLLLLPTFPRHLSWLPAIGSEVLNGAVVGSDSACVISIRLLFNSVWVLAHISLQTISVPTLARE